MTMRWRWSGPGVLFDMDGTLVDSGESVVRAWQWVADELDLPFSAFAPYVHGIPAGQVFALAAPSVPAAERDELIEAMLARQAEDTQGVRAIPGALAALDALPTARWAVVTSADQRLALARIRAAGLPLPRHLITAELTEHGKPSPEPFLLGASRLGFPPEACLVVEDSAAGVRSARDAGCPVLGVLTTSESLAGVNHAVPDLESAGFSADRLEVVVTATG